MTLHGFAQLQYSPGKLMDMMATQALQVMEHLNPQVTVTSVQLHMSYMQFSCLAHAAEHYFTQLKLQ